jgi:hypothetical protein
VTARRMLLDGLARDADVLELVSELALLHPRDDTFPGEVLLRAAADALDWCGANRAEPLSLEGLRERCLPERAFRGRQNSKFQCAVLAAAALHGGTEPACWRRSPGGRPAVQAGPGLDRAEGPLACRRGPVDLADHRRPTPSSGRPGPSPKTCACPGSGRPRTGGLPGRVRPRIPQRPRDSWLPGRCTKPGKPGPGVRQGRRTAAPRPATTSGRPPDENSPSNPSEKKQVKRSICALGIRRNGTAGADVTKA